MLTFHSVKIDGEIHWSNPLFVGNFFKLKGMWWKKRKERQNLILSIANAWYCLTKNNKTMPGFIEEEILLTSLTRKVKDAKVILEKFFEIIRIGFNFNNGVKSPTLISPKKLSRELIVAITETLDEVMFDPGPQPNRKNLVKATVRVKPDNLGKIILELKSTGKIHLIPAVKWLAEQEGEIFFFYEPAGKLLARDKSIWPIKSIETWPGWLRRELFGPGMDIDNAYCQFLLDELLKKYSSRPSIIDLKYPDLVKANTQKTEFRNHICVNILKLQLTDENIKVVKKLMMSLANGSNISPLMLLNCSGRSEAVNIVLGANPSLTTQDLSEAGQYLGFISKQFKLAAKDLCMHMFSIRPSKANQKMIFKAYMKWEREKRYKMWEATGFTGINAHDGIDGINLSGRGNLEQYLLQSNNLRVSVKV